MLKTIHLPSFAVIGKEGSTKEGPDFIKKLIEESSSSFSEVSHLGKKNEDGSFSGFWGLMSDFSRQFKPWENGFSEGLYLFGVECPLETAAPKGWVKWVAPEHDYLVKEVTPETYQDTFKSMVYYQIPLNAYKLAGACFDYSDPKTNKSYIYFPVVPNPLKPKKECLIDKIAPCSCHCAYCFFDECGGCGSKNDFCSMAAFSKDHKCPNVVCATGRGIKGCYECDKLESCHVGIFANPGNARAGAIFIKRYGKEGYEKAIKALLGKEKPYYEQMCDEGDDEKQVALLKKAIE